MNPFVTRDATNFEVTTALVRLPESSVELRIASLRSLLASKSCGNLAIAKSGMSDDDGFKGPMGAFVQCLSKEEYDEKNALEFDAIRMPCTTIC